MNGIIIIEENWLRDIVIKEESEIKREIEKDKYIYGRKL